MTSPDFRLRTTCRLCGGPLRLGLSLTPTPLANELLTWEFIDSGKPQDVFPLDVMVCDGCAHVQLSGVVNPERLFRHYPYRSGASKQFVDHLQAYADDVYERFKPKSVLEIGSNDGTMLRMFQERGCSVLGVEPAENIAKIARDGGVPTLVDFFPPFPKLAYEYDLVVANHVFAHADDLRGMATAVRGVLAPGGVFVFEVGYLVDLVQKVQFDVCIPPKDLVLTSEGWRAIEDIIVGNEVLTHRGRFRKVTQTFRRRFHGQLSVIQPYGSDMPMRMTSAHPVYVRRGMGEFVPAEQIVRGDVVLKPSIQESRKLLWLSIETFIAGRHRKKVVHKFRIGRDLTRVIGYYLAEGCYTVSGKSVGKHSATVQFAFGLSSKEKRLANDCLRRLKRLGASGSIRWTKFGWHVSTSGAMARLLFRECGTGEARKHVPRWSFTLGVNLVEELVRGYVQGDGYEYRQARYWRACTVSAELAHDMAVLSNKLGWACSVNKAKWKWTPRIIANNPRPTLRAKHPFDILMRREEKKRNKVHFESGYQHGTVRRVARRKYDGDVCNLAVADDNSYTTIGGAVHNCYHEHTSYHHLTPLLGFFQSLGMEVFDAQRVDTQGGSLRCFVRKESGNWSSSMRCIIGGENEAWRSGHVVDGQLRLLATRVEELRIRLHKLLYRTIKVNPFVPSIAAYGAPAKATTFLHQFGLGRETIDFVVDDSPLKQGLYLPGKQIPILPTSALYKRNPDYCLILSWNFADQIMRNNKEFKGKWIVPLPEFRVV